MRKPGKYYAKKQGGKLPCFCFDEVTSTSDAAKLIIHEGGAEEVFAVIAAEQSAGRGRMGRRFVSPRDKGIYLTLARRVARDGDYSPLGCFVSLAVCRFVEETFGVPCTLKWPNDVLSGGRKICGILPESVYGAGGERYVLVGMGVNVLTTEEDFGELAKIATSVLSESRKSDINLVLRGNTRAALIKLGGALAVLADETAGRWLAGDAGLVREYEERLGTVGEDVEFDASDGKRCRGRAVGVTADGALTVFSDGTMYTVRWGEVVTRADEARDD